MKKVLITGKTSYVGTKFAEYVKEHYADSIVTESISVRDDAWKSHDFSQYDVVLHVAGIAHVSTKKSMEELYYKVNRDLTIEVAKKAKASGVGQFIFMSSIIVYGKPKDGRITKDTLPNPENFYGKSKLQAEEGIKALESDEFMISIIRPPMIYGPGSKGNYLKLSKFLSKYPIFPSIVNRRSMIYIDNLSFLIVQLINDINGGLHLPQNKEYVCVSNLAKEIDKNQNSNIYFTKIFNVLIRVALHFGFKSMNSLFGNLYFHENNPYVRLIDIVDFKASITLTEHNL